MLNLFVTLLLASLALAHPVRRSEPPQYLFPVERNESGILESNTQQLIQIFQNEFHRDFAGSPWAFDFSWHQPYLGAGTLHPEHVFRILLWGGLVRAKYMTSGALAAVLCHELGHRLAGEPKQVGVEWASAEGAADQFAATICLPRIYKALRAEAPQFLQPSDEPIAKSLCLAHSWPEQCVWGVTSGIDLIQFLQVYFDRDIAFANPSLRALERPEATLTLQYPSYQCRMDIYIEGARCEEGVSCPPQPCWFVSK